MNGAVNATNQLQTNETKLKTNTETCEIPYVEHWEQDCLPENDPDNPGQVIENCGYWYLVGIEYGDPICTDDGNNPDPDPDPDPCLDPANFNTAECGGDGDGGGTGGAARVVTNDPSVTNDPKANCMISHVASSENSAYNKFLAAFINSTTYNVTFKMQPHSVVNDKEVDAYTSYKDNDPNVVIYLNASIIDANSSSEDARTVIHEMAHTYLAQKIISVGGPGNLKSNLDKSFEDLFEDYAKYIDPTTGNYNSNANNTAQHDYMAEHLINDIALGIKDFVEANTPAIKNDSAISMDNYTALAWSTLRSTQAYSDFLTNKGETTASQNTKISVLKSGTTNDCNQ